MRLIYCEPALWLPTAWGYVCVHSCDPCPVLYIRLGLEHVFQIPHAPTVSPAPCSLFSCMMSLYASLILFLPVSRCWLRLDTYFIWSFIGPATLIIMVRYTHTLNLTWHACTKQNGCQVFMQATTGYTKVSVNLLRGLP